LGGLDYHPGLQRRRKSRTLERDEKGGGGGGGVGGGVWFLEVYTDFLHSF